jgi:hypothetical protein
MPDVAQRLVGETELRALVTAQNLLIAAQQEVINSLEGRIDDLEVTLNTGGAIALRIVALEGFVTAHTP